MTSSDQQTATLSVGRETVEFRARHGLRGVLLERESRSASRRGGDVSVTQVIVADERTLHSFLQAEPYQDVINPTLLHIVDSVRGQVAARPQIPPKVDVLKELRLLATLPDETALIEQMMSIVRPLGADSAFFLLTEQTPEGHQQSHRILTGDHSDAIQTYVAKKWYATDPFLLRASRSHQPFFSSDIGLLENLSGSWRDMGEASRKRGMGSWIVAPAHQPNAPRFGALYAANNRLPADHGEEPLRHNRLLFKLLAGELLEWYANQEKLFALKNSGLTLVELQILNAVARDLTHASIADSLNLSLYSLRRQHIHSIIVKLKTKTIYEAARLASLQGLLAIASERKVGYVIYHDRWGTFLREDCGIPFWSNVNPEGIDEAQIFPDIETAQRALGSSSHGVQQCQFRRVDVYHTATTVSIAECAAAGIPRWDPSTTRVNSPPDASATWSALKGPPKDYH